MKTLKVQLLAALVGAMSLSGCAELKQLDDAAMNHVLEQRGQVGQLQPEPWPGEMKVPAEANCTFTAAYKEIHNCCLMKKYTTSVDPDTAFARSMQEYAFSDRMRPGEGYGYPHYHGHMYQTQPGAFYRLFGEVTPRSDVRLSRGVWLGLVIAKSGPNTSEVEPVYCEARGRRMKDQLTWHKAMQASIYATLPPLVARK